MPKVEAPMGIFGEGGIQIIKEGDLLLSESSEVIVKDGNNQFYSTSKKNPNLLLQRNKN